MKTLPFVAAAVLVLGLAGCAPTAPSDTTSGTDSSDTGSSDSSEESTDTDAFEGAVLSGTGDYTVPDQAPIGSYELPDDQDEQPAGCTWQLYLENGDLFVENQGPFLFITDVVGRFVTDGCPDWVQYQD